MTQEYSTQLLSEAVYHSNKIEGIPPGELADRHLLVLLACRIAAEEGGILHPRVLHQLLFMSGTFVWGWYSRSASSFVEGVVPGEYRLIAVRVGGYTPPPADRVPGMMEEWWASATYSYDCELTSATEAAADLWTQHVEFESIHPFVDGNGRVGRMLWWSQQMLAGLELEIIKYEEREAYYERLEATRKELGAL